MKRRKCWRAVKPILKTAMSETILSTLSIGKSPLVEFESSVLQQIRQHARTSMDQEICGVLLGAEEDGITRVVACIRGEKAAQGGAHVTFTQETWAHIYQVKDSLFPDQAIVGWYHSHPGFGIFLSDYDLFIHESFFGAVHQVAWVFDPHSDEEGCFGWIDKRVLPLTKISVLKNPAQKASNPTQNLRSQKEVEGSEPTAAISDSMTTGQSSAKKRIPWAKTGLFLIGGLVFLAVVVLVILRLFFPERLTWGKTKPSSPEVHAAASLMPENGHTTNGLNPSAPPNPVIKVGESNTPASVIPAKKSK